MGRALPGLLKVKIVSSECWILQWFSNDPTLDPKKKMACVLEACSLHGSSFLGSAINRSNPKDPKENNLYSELKHFTDLKIAEIWPIC